MRCMSCTEEIDPKWAHAIDNNICPWCGKFIMEQHMKNLFSTLRETMSSLSEYQESLDDWMLSNHKYIKTDSESLVSYVPQELLKNYAKTASEDDFLRRKESQKKYVETVKTDSGDEEVLVEKIQSDEKANEFFNRASGNLSNKKTIRSPSERTQFLKNQVARIKKDGVIGVDDNGSNIIISAEMLKNADSDAANEYQQMLSGGEMIGSSIDSEVDDDFPGGDSILQANMQAAGRNSHSGGPNAKDMATLQRMQAKFLKSQKTVANGTGGKGSFSRA